MLPNRLLAKSLRVNACGGKYTPRRPAFIVTPKLSMSLAGIILPEITFAPFTSMPTGFAAQHPLRRTRRRMYQYHPLSRQA